MAQLVFAILLLSALYIFFRSVKKIWTNIQLGQKTELAGDSNERWKNVFLIAFGQKKMFQKPLVAFLHLMVYAGFLVVNIELLEIILDGLLGTHRLFHPVLGSFYPVLINLFEFFAVLVLISCVVFFIRRNITKVRRFHLKEMTAWPKLDGNLILVFEIVLMLLLLSMNTTDTLIQNAKGQYQSFIFSDLLIPLYEGMSPHNLHTAERIFWWTHIIGIFFFANYVPHSKHLHIFLAFPNTYFGKLEPVGQMENMDAVTQEVKIMLGTATPNNEAAEVARFGAKDVLDLSTKNLLNAYSCTECGRCTAECPANLTGKALSPRKIMMDTRDRLEEVGKSIGDDPKTFDDGKSLLGDYITDEELFACTTCNACVQACPINIDPVDIILKLRRYKSMEEGQGPNEWNMMYQNIETSFSPWKFPPSDRFNWAKQTKKD